MEGENNPRLSLMFDGDPEVIARRLQPQHHLPTRFASGGTACLCNGPPRTIHHARALEVPRVHSSAQGMNASRSDPDVRDPGQSVGGPVSEDHLMESRHRGGEGVGKCRFVKRPFPSQSRRNLGPGPPGVGHSRHQRSQNENLPTETHSELLSSFGLLSTLRSGILQMRRIPTTE